MKFLFLVLVVVLIIIGFNMANDDTDSEPETEEVAPVVEPAPEKPVEPEPVSEPQLPTKQVRICRADGNPHMYLCEKVSHHATRLPYPYGEGSHGIQKARELGWCKGVDQGDILRVSEDYWDVREYPIQENWPANFPYLIKVYTEDGREWWV